jgi:hypothetical protein
MSFRESQASPFCIIKEIHKFKIEENIPNIDTEN